MNENMTRKTWEEFRESGLLWWANKTLHMFGWALVFEYDDFDRLTVRPCRVKYRGFGEKADTIGYRKVSEYLKENIDELVDEARK